VLLAAIVKMEILLKERGHVFWGCGYRYKEGKLLRAHFVVFECLRGERKPLHSSARTGLQDGRKLPCNVRASRYPRNRISTRGVSRTTRIVDLVLRCGMWKMIGTLCSTQKVVLDAGTTKYHLCWWHLPHLWHTLNSTFATSTRVLFYAVQAPTRHLARTE
jgi:hypothetical protein